MAHSTRVDTGCKRALEYLLEFLMREKRLSWDKAYMLSSIAADLKIFEVVDRPHVLCGAMIPKGIFDN